MDKYRAYFKDLRKRQRKWQKSQAKFIKIKYVPYTYYQKAARDPSSYVVDSGYCLYECQFHRVSILAVCYYSVELTGYF
jgi:hypothetical protein